MISEDVHSRPEAAGAGVRTVALGDLWHRFGLAAVLLLTAVLDLWRLAGEGYGNAYYASAVRSMMQSWHNFFFNSYDPGGFVSIDKPPLGFWLQVLSAKLFGFHGWALMLPQAVAGILSVALLYALVRRPFGPAAGLMAALALAVTPVLVVTARNNIIDATLTFVLLLAAWAVGRAAETGRLRWVVLGAVLMGLGFNVKMLEAYLAVPALGLMYLVAARIGWGRRLAYLTAGLVIMVAVSLSWVTAVDMTPASQRPWVGSTSSNSELDLAIGYNGIQRLTGNVNRGGRPPAARPSGSNPPPGFTRGETGSEGPLRLFNEQLGGQIGWLLPLAVIGLVAAAWETRRRWPLDERQAALVLWGMWLLTTWWFFSVAGFFHSYYLVTMAPPVGALSGIGVAAMWRLYRDRRSHTWWLLPLALLIVSWAQAQMLAPYTSWARWLTPLIAGCCLLAALLLVAARLSPRRATRFALPAAALGSLVLLSAPAAWAADTVSTTSTGMTPSAGPRPPAGSAGFGGFRRPPGSGFVGFRGRPGARGFDRGQSVSHNLLRYLERHRGDTRFLFATESSMTADPYILQTGQPVMALGGFMGADPILSLSALQTDVRNNTVRYFLLPGAEGDPGALFSRVPPQLREQIGRRFGGGFGRLGSSNRKLIGWVQQRCALVPPHDYGTVSISNGPGGTGVFGSGRSPGTNGGLRGAGTTGPDAYPPAGPPPTGFSGFGGGDKLYDCATVR